MTKPGKLFWRLLSKRQDTNENNHDKHKNQGSEYISRYHLLNNEAKNPFSNRYSVVLLRSSKDFMQEGDSLTEKKEYGGDVLVHVSHDKKSTGAEYQNLTSRKALFKKVNDFAEKSYKARAVRPKVRFFLSSSRRNYYGGKRLPKKYRGNLW